EDGIRDGHVTGVQTCALPISGRRAERRGRGVGSGGAMTVLSSLRGRIFLTSALLAVLSIGVALSVVNVRVTREAESQLQREVLRSEERRVGEGGGAGGGALAV